MPRAWRLKLVAFAASLSSLTATLSVPSAADDLVVGAFGGVWEQSLRECVIKPFEAKTGKKVSVVLGAPAQWLNQIAANPSKPPLDVIYLPTDNAFDAINRGLVERITVEKVPEIAELEPRFREIGDGYGVVNNYGAQGLVYNTETVKSPPKTWKEFVEGTIAGKWKASIPSINYAAGGMTVAGWLYSDLYGGTLDDIGPGLAMVKKMRDSKNLLFWTDPNQFLNQLKDGDFDIGSYWDGRAWTFIDSGNPKFKFYTPEPGGVAAMSWIDKVKGGSELAWEYIKVGLSKEPQSCFGSKIRYGVAHAKAEYDPKIKHQITDLSALLFPPFKDITPERQAKWVDQWNREIGR